jgi:hypothetical protein
MVSCSRKIRSFLAGHYWTGYNFGMNDIIILEESKPPTDADFAWAAGFFDGEGTCGFYIRGNTYGQFHLSCSQCDPEVLYRLQDILGGIGTIKGPMTSNQFNHNDYYRYDVSSPREIKIIASILWQYLGSVKKKQITEAFQKYEMYMSRPRSTYGRGNPKLTQDQKAEIVSIYSKGGITQRDLAEQFGVSHTTIYYALRSISA